MARRVKYHPSVIISGGEPMDGDMAPDDRNYSHEDDDGGPGGARPSQADDDRWTRMEAEVARLREENTLIKRAIPPAEPVRAQPEEELSDEEFDALLFSNPRQALDMYGKKIKDELRQEYVTNQGTSSFWTKFYAANGDLKDDDDLVQSTLQKNMAELGNMPVDNALNRLAELTRDRIMGFMKKTRNGGRSRAVAEGANPPNVPQAQADDDDGGGRQTTMGDLLKARRAGRRRAAQAA